MLSSDASLQYYKITSYSLNIFSAFIHKEKSQFLMHIFSVFYFQMVHTMKSKGKKNRMQHHLTVIFRHVKKDYRPLQFISNAKKCY